MPYAFILYIIMTYYLHSNVHQRNRRGCHYAEEDFVHGLILDQRHYECQACSEIEKEKIRYTKDVATDKQIRGDIEECLSATNSGT